MGFVEGLHHLDAKALIRAEEHCVVDGASWAAPLLGSHEVPWPPAPEGVIGSGGYSAGVGLAAALRYARGACSDLAKSEDRSCCVRRACCCLEAMALGTPTLALCIGQDRWFADPRTTATVGSQRLKSQVIAGVDEIKEGVPTLANRKRHDDPTSSRKHPELS
jgi:hypothetical protein